MAHLLDWFWELDAGRSGHGMGPNPISWAEMFAWSALTGAAPEGWEIRALRSMDFTRITFRRAEQEPEAPRLTPDVFAAMVEGTK